MDRLGSEDHAMICRTSLPSLRLHKENMFSQFRGFDIIQGVVIWDEIPALNTQTCHAFVPCTCQPMCFNPLVTLRLPCTGCLWLLHLYPTSSQGHFATRVSFRFANFQECRLVRFLRLTRRIRMR